MLSLVPQRSRVRIPQVGYSVILFGNLNYVCDSVVKRFTFAISHLMTSDCSFDDLGFVFSTGIGYESYGMQISDAFGSHLWVWRHRSS